MNRTGLVLVTPARNEEATLEITIRSVLSQTLQPKEWIIVSDGSTDRTDDIVRHFSFVHSFIRLFRLPARPARSFSSVVFATEAGCKAIHHSDYAFLGLLDADVRFQPDYFAELLSRFESDPKLGLAGGLVVDVEDGFITRQRQNLREVAGAVHFFRRECFESLGGLVPIPEGGWDTITAVQARANGFTTRTFPDLIVDHLKPRNSGEGGVIKRKWQMGLRDYAVGNHVFWEMIKCSTRAVESPFLLGAIVRLTAFAWCALSGRQRVLRPKMIELVRREQWVRILPFQRRKASTNGYQPRAVVR